jgi:hypothetical protein
MSKPRECLPSLRIGAALLGAALLAGCQSLGSPQGPGTMTFAVPGYRPTTPDAPPPPGLEGTATTIPSKPSPRTGPYAGIGRVLADPGGSCGDPIRISNFIVRGNQVSFGSFNGTIQPDGSLQMQAGPTYIEGQFIGTHFEGRFWRPGPACTYMLSLEPVT